MGRSLMMDIHYIHTTRLTSKTVRNRITTIMGTVRLTSLHITFICCLILALSTARGKVEDDGTAGNNNSVNSPYLKRGHVMPHNGGTEEGMGRLLGYRFPRIPGSRRSRFGHKNRIRFSKSVGEKCGRTRCGYVGPGDGMGGNPGFGFGRKGNKESGGHGKGAGVVIGPGDGMRGPAFSFNGPCTPPAIGIQHETHFNFSRSSPTLSSQNRPAYSSPPDKSEQD